VIGCLRPSYDIDVYHCLEKTLCDLLPMHISIARGAWAELTNFQSCLGRILPAPPSFDIVLDFDLAYSIFFFVCPGFFFSSSDASKVLKLCRENLHRFGADTKRLHYLASRAPRLQAIQQLEPYQNFPTRWQVIFRLAEILTFWINNILHDCLRTLISCLSIRLAERVLLATTVFCAGIQFCVFGVTRMTLNNYISLTLEFVYRSWSGISPGHVNMKVQNTIFAKDVIGRIFESRSLAVSEYFLSISL